jgi:P-aminobenzoate N-oxygenase AurF
MDRRIIPSAMDTVFEFDYTVQAEDMRGLYEKAKRDQWNATRDINWTTPEPSDGRVLADELVDIHGSPIWERLSEKDRVELNRRITAWRLSVLVYGEQGALLACSQLVDTVAGTDAKFFQATQVVDEARHNEVLERYIQHRLGGLHYPMPENERFIFDAILTDSRWYIKTIALQLVAETFAVSMFRMMQECAVDPLLGEICGRILQDESRHMGFGMLALPAIVRDAGERERHEMEDFTCSALEKVLTGFFPAEAYRDIGFSAAQIAEVQSHRRGVAARSDYGVFRKHFRREMHTSMVANLARIGLLTERVRPRLETLGIQLPAPAA